MTENLYPNLNITDSIIKDLNKSRIDEMNTNLTMLEKDLKRYTKLLRRWKNTSKGLTISGAVLIGFTSIASGVILFPSLAVPLVVPGILGISGVLEGTLLEGLNMSICQHRINYLDKKASLVKSYIDKLYYYTQKAKTDNVITLEEIEGFHRILDEYRKELTGIKVSGIDKKLIKKAQTEVDKEMKNIFLEQMKEEILRSRLGGNSNLNLIGRKGM